ncbi:MAG: hypothetical protein WA858_11645 [Xanthobacteraceae bacterium]|jgi:hypothetical protein
MAVTAKSPKTVSASISVAVFRGLDWTEIKNWTGDWLPMRMIRPRPAKTQKPQRKNPRCDIPATLDPRRPAYQQPIGDSRLMMECSSSTKMHCEWSLTTAGTASYPVFVVAK